MPSVALVLTAVLGAVPAIRPPGKPTEPSAAASAEAITNGVGRLPPSERTAPKLSPPWAEEPIDPQPRTEDMNVATDGKGHYVAYASGFESFSERLFAGDGKAFFRQRVFGGSSDGSTGAFEYTFWDPRVRGRAGGSLESKQGKLTLDCREGQRVPLQVLPGAEAKKILAKATFMKPRWRRLGYALARDDAGTYYYIDRAREPDDTKDFRLYVGAKGKLQGWQLTDHIEDVGGDIYKAPAGRLEYSRRSEAEWVAGSQRTPVTRLPIEDQARFIYTDLGVYAGEKLGTLCDAFFDKP